MTTWKTIVLTAFISALVAFGVARQTETGTKKSDISSVFDRVMETQTLRCGYNFYEPGFMKNEETGEFYGLYYDLVEEMGRLLNIDIEWAQLVDWGSMAAAIESGKVDAFCISVWPNAVRGKKVLFSDSFLYVNVEAYGRAGDDRFENNLTAINNDDVVIATIDNDISGDIAKSQFPKAQTKALTQFGTDADLFNDLKYKKSDVTFTTHSVFLAYNRENPNVIKRLDINNPLRTFGTTIALPMGDFKLKAMIDTAIEQMVNNGNVEGILKDYEDDYPETFFPVAEPFRAP